MYEVHLSVRAQKFLEKLDKHISLRIETALARLKENPVPSDAKFITRDESGKVFRYRVGSYRALYLVKEQEGIILVAVIDTRPRVYKQR